MTATIWLRTIRTSVLWFAILGLLAFVLATAAFSYAFGKYLPEGKVLGVTAQNQSSGLSLFSGKVQLVKTGASPVVYALIGKFKYPIRNEEVFYSYDYNLRNVRLITNAELNKYQLVRLVKERGTGKTYFLGYAQNVKKYHPTPQAFAAYPANSWADVVEVSSKDLSYYDDAVLLKEPQSAKVYYIAGGKKAWIPTENEFNNAGFSWHKILTVAQADLDTYPNLDFNIELVRGSQPAATGVVQPADTTVSTTKQVIVSLDSSSPQASIFPFATAGNLVAAFRFQAAGGNVTIKSLTFTKKGLLDISKISSLKIADENGLEFISNENTNINNNTITVSFPKNPIVITRNVPKVLLLKVNFAPGNETNQTANFGLAAENSIEADAVITGIFPLFGATHKLMAATDLIGQVQVESREVNQTAREVSLGAKSETVAKFVIKETSGIEKAAISGITLTNVGNASEQSVDYLSLYQDGKVIATVRYPQNQRAVFDLAKNNIIVSKDKPVEILVKVDILKGEGSTFKLVIDDPSDIKVKGLTQGFNLVVSSPEKFPIGLGAADGYNKIVFRRLGIGLIASKMEAKDTEIFRAQADTILGQFELRNMGQDIYLQRLKFQMKKFNGAPDIADDIYLMDKASRQILVTFGREKVEGQVVADVSLGNYKIAANASLTFWAVSKVPENAQTNNTYQVNIPELSYKIGLDNIEYTQAVAAVGQLMRVYAPQLTITAGTLINNGVAVAGAKTIELANFSLQASADEQIRVTNIVMSLATSSNDVVYSGGFSEFALYSGGRVSNIISQPNSRTYTFANLNFTIGAGATLKLTVNADTESITAGKTVQFKLESITAEGSSSHAPVDTGGEGTVSNSVKISTAPGS